MVYSMKPVSRGIPLPMPFAILTMFSTTFTAIVFMLSILNLTSRPLGQSNSSPWFDVATSVVTLLFHLYTLVTIMLRLRRGSGNASSLLEKGLVQIPPQEAAGLFSTNPTMAWFAILFAVWIVAFGATLYEVMLRPTFTSVEKGNVAFMILETIVVAAMGVYIFIGGRKSVTGRDDLTRKEKRFTTGELPRPLVLKGTLLRSVSKESIGNPSPPPANLPEKLAPVNAMLSPPGLSPPAKAVRPEPRYNGMRTLVLVDPRMELAAQTSYHGSVSSASSQSSYSVPSA